MSEATSRINVLADGPFEVSGQVQVKHQDGTAVDHDATVYLCRCGKSENKPFCDGSHEGAGFADPGVIVGGRLVGEAAGGALEITCATNGPLLVAGATDLHATDGVVMRGARGALCRCGQSATKPFCDGSHKAAGFCAE